MSNDRLILLCDIGFDGGIQAKRVATAPWITPYDDPVGTIQYAGDIIADPEFQQTVSTAVWSSESATSIGAIEINNVDGKYDSWLGLRAADSRVTFRTVRPGEAYGDAVVVWRGILLRVEPVDRQRLRLVLDTFHALLRRPLFTVNVADSDGNEKSSPVMIGACGLINPVLVDAPSIDFQFSDSRTNGLNTVYSSGAPFDSGQWVLIEQQNHFHSTITPGGRVTATGFGNFGFDANVIPNSDFDSWAGGVPNNWTFAVVTGNGSIEEVPGVGVRMLWQASSLITLTANSGGNVLPDVNAGWYLVKGRIARITNGHLGVRFRDTGTVIAINQEGDFSRIVYVAAGPNRTVRIGSDGVSAAGDLVLDYIEVRKVGANQSQLLPYAIEQVVNAHGPLRYDQINTGSINDLVSAANKTVGYYQPHGGAETIESILWQLLAGWTGWWYIDELGELRVGRLEAPVEFENPDLTLTALDIIGGISARTDLAQKLSDHYAGGRRWSPYTESELSGLALEDPTPFTEPYGQVRKGIGALDQAYARARGADPVKTLIAGGGAQVQAEADRVTDELFSVERRFYELRASLQSAHAALSLRPGAQIRVAYPRYGLDAGKNLRLIGKRCRFLRGEVQLILWG